MPRYLVTLPNASANRLRPCPRLKACSAANCSTTTAHSGNSRRSSVKKPSKQKSERRGRKPASATSRLMFGAWRRQAGCRTWARKYAATTQTHWILPMCACPQHRWSPPIHCASIFTGSTDRQGLLAQAATADDGHLLQRWQTRVSACACSWRWRGIATSQQRKPTST